MNYCMKCGKPTDNGMICEDCMVNDSPWLSAMKIKENDLEQEITELKAENAELKARLEKAVELKAKAGDTVYMPWVYDGVSDIAKLHICLIIMDSETITYAVDFIADLGDAEKGFMKKYKHGQFTKKDFGKIVFTDYTEAEARLAKLRCNI